MGYCDRLAEFRARRLAVIFAICFTIGIDLLCAGQLSADEFLAIPFGLFATNWDESIDAEVVIDSRRSARVRSPTTTRRMHGTGLAKVVPAHC